MPGTSPGTLGCTTDQRREPTDRRITVSIVDDADDIRSFVRLALELDGRFEVVSEASDGDEAIDMLGEVTPDVVLLDRQMPRLGGVEALPEIRRRAPHALVILYTAAADDRTYQAAIAAGAIDVVDKTNVDISISDHLAQILVDYWADPDASVDVRVGPVDCEIAQAWVANTSRILAAVRAHPEVLPEPIPDDVAEMFAGLLETWGEVANGSCEFVWVGRARPSAVRRIVEYWAMVDRLPEDVLEGLGCQWSGPDARPFFDALTAGVMDALQSCEETRELAQRLSGQWEQSGT